MILKLNNVNNRIASEKLVKKEIFVSRDDLPELYEGYYLNDVIGFNVIDEKNNLFGTLIDILDLNGNEVIVVEFRNKNFLVPNVEEYVKLFDFNGKRVIVKNIEQFINEK